MVYYLYNRFIVNFLDYISLLKASKAFIFFICGTFEDYFWIFSNISRYSNRVLESTSC
ncbi:hypothetical protein A6J35_006250 [Borreliella burgdorferi]|uniref:Uncharacterized protein n=1 Tax=Borreliella burgdorferi (strain ATCC 35210 / DSM 4680 / CIP 102532 / B31) TaxID=224326 RepID=G5IXI9_BORBU|nr:hypothetical protein BB_Q0091 [Borreliella burgdorferi B31]PNL87348.1 hypothetical protein A6J35_006250 [Borreliella burgdorferi]